MKKSFILSLLPVFFGFFVMGFVDVVGISTNYVKDEFNLSEAMSGFLPSVVFIWFFLLSYPTAIVMNIIGRKNTVLISMIVTIAGMFLPFFIFDKVTCYLAFAFLGIGNTILQVSLNPLVSNIFNGKALTSALTGGQVVKALSSFCGPLIASFAVLYLGNWQNMFPVFGGITILSGVWLLVKPIPKEEMENSTTGNPLKLLSDHKILLFFLGIVAVVGIDVGMNMISKKLLIERLAYNNETANLGASMYFICRTFGAFIGTFLLAVMSSRLYFRTNMLVTLGLLLLLAFIPLPSLAFVLSMIGAIGFACSSIFSVVFSAAIQAKPEKTNEISGLMITGVVGGAIFPPLMTFSTQLFSGAQMGGLLVLSGATLYLFFLAGVVKK
ncbi:MAG: MFS transporter [Lentimicrobiaceae bacterium]|nr:MFS transporter [Lentimicrobiaceae bacterium]